MHLESRCFTAFQMYYPQQFFYSHDNKWNEKRLFVDNLFHPVDTHHFYSFGTFLFSAFSQAT